MSATSGCGCHLPVLELTGLMKAFVKISKNPKFEHANLYRCFVMLREVEMSKTH